MPNATVPKSHISEEFLEEFRDRIQALLSSDQVETHGKVSPREIAFTTVMLEDLQETGQLPALETVHFLDQSAGGRLTAYGVPESSTTSRSRGVFAAV